CLQTLGALLDVELNALVLLEVTTTGARNRAEVRENVGGAVLGGDEAVALVGVEPGDDASSHGDIPSLSYATCVARVSVAAAPLRICCTPREATAVTVLTFDTGGGGGLEGGLRRDRGQVVTAADNAKPHVRMGGRGGTHGTGELPAGGGRME